MSEDGRRGLGESLAAELRAQIELLGLRTMSAHYIPDRDVMQLYWRSLREPSKDDGLSFPATAEWTNSVLDLLQAHARATRGDLLGAEAWQRAKTLSISDRPAGNGRAGVSPYTLYYHSRARRAAWPSVGISTGNTAAPPAVRGLLWSSRRHTGTLLLKHPGR